MTNAANPPRMLAALTVALVLAHPGLAQTMPATQTRLPGPFTLVKDYGDTAYAGDALRLTQSISAGAYHFFTANTVDAGTELWRTDGTPEGTLRLRDICPGRDDSVGLLGPQEMAVLNNRLLFAAKDCASGTELWISDGTPGGTRRLLDLQPGAGGSSPSNMVVVGSHVFFTAYVDQQFRIWRSDGTAAGTTNTGWQGTPIFAMNGALYFRETSNANACRLFKLVALTLASTELSPVCPTQSTADREHDQIAVGANIAIYVASTPANGSEVWRTDGTPAGTRLLSDIAAGSANANPNHLAANGANFAFAANDGVNGAELWKSDGGINTSMVRDINAGAGSSDPHDIVYHNGAIYFIAFNSAVSELWRSNGFSGGTSVLVDTTAPDASSSPYGLRSSQGDLYFVSLINAQDYALFKSDGTVGNATQLYQADIDHISAFGAGVFLAINDPATGIEPWFSSGAPAGTIALGDLAGGETISPEPVNLRALNGMLLHFGNRTTTTGSGSSELYRSDGTPAGSQSLRSFAFAPKNAFDVDYSPVVWKNLLFFNALPADDGSGREIWRSNGITAGTTQYVDLVAGQYLGSDPADLTATTNRLFFVADTPTYGPELWQTSGTPESTSLSRDILPGTDGGEPKHLTADDSSGVYFSAYDAQGDELWHSDGTPGGTARVRDLLPGSANGNPAHLTWTGTRLFFTANSTINSSDNGVNRELWVSDGTEAGTRLVKDITPGEDSTGFTAYESDPFVTFGNRIVFVASTDTFGAELWISDGTEAGTRLVKDIAVNAADSNPDAIVATADRIYFAATDATGARTLWVSDGTTDGTLPVFSGAGAPVNPEELTVIDGVLYFSAADAAGAHGREVWISDGTAAGTRMLQDLNPGPTNSDPTEITRAGNRLYLAAYTPGGGRELWSARLPAMVYLPLARK